MVERERFRTEPLSLTAGEALRKAWNLLAFENVLLATFLGDFSRRKSETDNGSIVERHETQNKATKRKGEKKDQRVTY